MRDFGAGVEAFALIFNRISMDSDVWRPRCGVEMTNKMDAELSRLLLSCSSRKAEWRISFRGRPEAQSSSSGSVWLLDASSLYVP